MDANDVLQNGGQLNYDDAPPVALDSDDWPIPEPLDRTPPIFPVRELPQWMRDFYQALSVELQVAIDMVAALGIGVWAAACARRS